MEAKDRSSYPDAVRILRDDCCRLESHLKLADAMASAGERLLEDLEVEGLYTAEDDHTLLAMKNTIKGYNAARKEKK